ncbi:MAG: hydroxyacid dehydrogenase [Victivallales bacterium]|nr:hydroxyacid dehydrogenase [Victivallales bacterium]
MKKILILSGMPDFRSTFWCEEVERKLQAYGYEIAQEEMTGRALTDLPVRKDVEAVVTSWRSPRCTEEIFRVLPNLRYLGHSAGSVTGVATPELFARGVRVFSANWMMSHAVAEWSLLMTLLYSRNFFCATCWNGNQRMNWENDRFNMHEMPELNIGCWGYGDVTRHFLRQIAPFRPGRVLVTSNHADEKELASAGAEKVSLEELLRLSDVFHCLVGINASTMHRIGKNELAMLKDGAALVNCGRPALVVEEPLVAELKARRLYAYLDVFYQEPLPEDSPLYQLPNLVMTPHNAGFPGRKTFLPFILDEFHRADNQQPCLGEISRQRLDTMTVESMSRK